MHRCSWTLHAYILSHRIGTWIIVIRGSHHAELQPIPPSLMLSRNPAIREQTSGFTYDSMTTAQAQLLQACPHLADDHVLMGRCFITSKQAWKLKENLQRRGKLPHAAVTG